MNKQMGTETASLLELIIRLSFLNRPPPIARRRCHALSRASYICCSSRYHSLKNSFQDTTLKRCFGVDGKTIDFDYAYLKTLRTLEAPHVPMATLREVLELMCQPALKDMWLLLDIKIDNDAEDIVRLTGETLQAVGGGVDFWGGRVVLGCWTLKFVPVSALVLLGGTEFFG